MRCGICLAVQGLCGPLGSIRRKMLAKSKADKLIAQAKDKMDWADGMDAKTLYPEQYGRASDDYSSSLAAYKTEDYPESADKARLTVEAVDSIAVADADAAIAQAKAALSAAEAIGAPTNYPTEYGQAKTDLPTQSPIMTARITSLPRRRREHASRPSRSSKPKSSPGRRSTWSGSYRPAAIACGASPSIPSSTTTRLNGP